jgi:hypothetical protein
MSSDPLYVQPDGVRSYAQIHDQVASALSQVMGVATPEAVGVVSTHGPIASAVSTALGQVLGGRQGTLQATSTSAQTISELLQKAAEMYEQGDQQGAEKLKAAAEAIEGKQGGQPRNSGAPGSPTSTGAGGGDVMGQMLGQLGQVGQQVGQMAQAVGAPLQGLAQPLQQVPQQVMQAVQQASQAAGKAADATGAAKGDSAAPQQDSRSEETERHEPLHRAEAAPGDSANTGRAPETPEHAKPAQTRPQTD